MSTQSISQITLTKTKQNLNEVLACNGNKINSSSRFGFKFNIPKLDMFTINYLYDLVNYDRNCHLIFSDECTLEQINKLVIKYK